MGIDSESAGKEKRERGAFGVMPRPAQECFRGMHKRFFCLNLNAASGSTKEGKTPNAHIPKICRQNPFHGPDPYCLLKRLISNHFFRIPRGFPPAEPLVEPFQVGVVIDGHGFKFVRPVAVVFEHYQSTGDFHQL